MWYIGSMPDTVIDLIRHGEPVGGRAYRGHGVDDPLSDKGWMQMWQGVSADACPWQAVVSSPMRRCREFASQLAQKQALPLSVDERFKEVGFGAWEGRTPQEILASDPDQYEAFYADPVHNRPPGAEPLAQFRDRVEQAYLEMLQTFQGKHILLVSHAGVMRAIIANVLHAGALGMYAIKINNAGLARIRIGSRGPAIECINAENAAVLARIN